MGSDKDKLGGFWGCCSVVLLSGVSAYAGGKTCVQDGSSVTEVCLEWSDALNPQPVVDFQVGFTDPLNPEITLITGDLGWIVYSEVVSTSVPANIGALRLNPAVSTDNFEVTIEKDGGAGAANVGSADLTAVGWTGESSISAGIIDGDFTGDLRLQRGSTGGVLSDSLSDAFIIRGDLTGTIEVPVIHGALFIEGDVSGTLEVTETVDGGVVVVSTVSSTGEVILAELENTVSMAISGDNLDFSGTLRLTSGVPAKNTVAVLGDLKSTGVIDVANERVDGVLKVGHTQAGSQITIGTVGAGGLFNFVPPASRRQVYGDLTVGSIEKGGAIQIEVGFLYGSIEVTGDHRGIIAV